ncbi:MAG: nucleotidyltransferase [Chloroflexi bacterium]|nr:nucleotidyltransferase [Chloroflexota bacterium]
MKHVQTFVDFMKDEVNLNQSRIDLLEKRLKTITNFLKESDLLKDNFLETKPQGSYAHKTIIKPLPNKEFDVDILVFLKEFEDWGPKDYINNIYYLFKNNETYEDMVYRRTRCIVINYSGDFHIDLVPCIEIEGQYYIFNRKENEREKTDGEGYDNWFRNQNSIVGGKQLIKVTRLTKYLRDIKGTFSAKSILLTTLLGNQIYATENSSDFSDIPTSLKTIFNRLDTYLQASPYMPRVENPVLSGEYFDRLWDQEKYSNFRDKINLYTAKINSAYDEQNRNESIKNGEKFL